MLPCSTFLDVRSCYACFSSLRMGLSELRPVLPDGFRAGEYSAFRCLPAISNGVQLGSYSMEANREEFIRRFTRRQSATIGLGVAALKTTSTLTRTPIPQRPAPAELLWL